MTELSQMPLVGPLKRRGWAEIVWFRPLTASTHATLVATRRGRLASVLPAGGPRVLSDYLAWPYDFREVDTRERLLALDQRLESFDSSYEFSVSLRLIYQVVRPDRVALEIEDVSTELTHAVVQSLRLSGRSFGVEQDKIFEEHLQETLITSDALAQRVQLLGLVLRRVDAIVTLDEPTRAHAEALRFAMRERPLHFQIAVESLEPDRSFDVHVGGAYRLTERRAQDEPGDRIDSAIQTAITRTLQRIGITFEPSDYTNAAKAMAEVLRKDMLLQSELAMVHAQLLRPTVQIQPDRSMVHIPRSSGLSVAEMRHEPMLRRSRQSLPRMGRRPALEDKQARVPQPAPAPAVRRALPPPAAQPVEIAAGSALPLGELPAPGDSIEGADTLWPLPEARPTMPARPTPGQPDDEPDGRAPWADLIRSDQDQADDVPWLAAPSASLSAPAEPLPWESLQGADQPMQREQTPAWPATPPAAWRAPAEPLPWEHSTIDGGRDGGADQLTLGAARADQEAESGPDAVSEPEIAPPAPAFLDSDPADDLGFSLDWSEPDAAQVAGPAANLPAPTDTTIVDDLGFALNWSDLQLDPYAVVPVSSADTIADDSIITAHWNDQDMSAPWNDQGSAVPAPTLFGDPPTPAYDSAAAVIGNLDRWPTADAPLEAFGAAWPDAPTPSEPSVDVAADAPTDAPLEAFGAAWADAPTPSEPAYAMAADADIQPPDEAPTAELAIETASDQAPSDANNQIIAHAESATDVSTELIARMIGMIQSYGPAWFKMWSLELKERPERLSVVLGEVTADPVLLAQADDPHVQSALLAALVVYTSPPVLPARLPSASLPSPMPTSQSGDDQDEVPDWLSLRVKWNGHGGGT